MRETNIPAQTVREDIQSLQEFPTRGNAPGFVRVVVGRVDESGTFIVPQQLDTIEITGADFTELTGPPTAWAPDKPPGTYRNADCWHFIDLIRAARSAA